MRHKTPGEQAEWRNKNWAKHLHQRFLWYLRQVIRILADSPLNQNHILLIHSFVVGLHAKHIFTQEKKQNKTKKRCQDYVHSYMLALPEAELDHALRVKRFGRRAGCSADGPPFQETRDGEWLMLTMWVLGEESGLPLEPPLALIWSQVSPRALAKWSSTEPVMDTELVTGSGSL